MWVFSLSKLVVFLDFGSTVLFGLVTFDIFMPGFDPWAFIQTLFTIFTWALWLSIGVALLLWYNSPPIFADCFSSPRFTFLQFVNQLLASIFHLIEFKLIVFWTGLCSFIDFAVHVAAFMPFWEDLRFQSWYGKHHSHIFALFQAHYFLDDRLRTWVH